MRWPTYAARRTTAGLLLIFTACSGSEAVTIAVPDAIDVLAPSSLMVGSSQQLTARISARGTPLSGVVPAWTSSDGAIISVSTSGVATALARGTATISASVGSARGSVALTALGVRTVTIQPATLALDAGASQPLVATVDADPGVTAPAIAWTSAAPTIATVSSSGIVTGVAAGTTTITASSQGKSATAGITVRPPVPVAAVVVTPATASLEIGATQRFSASARAVDGTSLTGRPVTWSSANAAVATMAADGVATAVAPGTTTITATVEGRSAAATLTVRPPPGVTSVTIRPVAGNSAEVDRETPLTAVVTADPGISTAVRWSTDAPGRATIGSDGVLRGHAPGPVVVTAVSTADTTKRSSVMLEMRWPTSAAPSAIAIGGTTWPWDDALMCAIKSGRVACWGNALFSGTGFLSQPENVRSEMLVSPRSINSSDSFAMIAAGARHACGLTTTRGIRCWGSNERAALGRGTINGHADPASPSVSGEFVQVSTGLYSSCALDTSARAWCWGSNDYGTAGSPNPPTEMLTPTQVVGGFQWRSVTTGWNHTCGITTADRLHCWGYEYGSVPREIGAGRRWASVSPGGDLLCGITTAAELFCWSVNAAPRIVETKDPVVRVDVGTHHRCTVTVLQQALCWGNGTGGSLGLWTAEVMLPTVGPSGTWRTIDAGEAFESCGVRSDGAVMCWGTNKGGRLGLGYPALPGIRVTTPSKIVQEVRGGGNHHRCLVLQDGSGSCSGWNNSGQLGTLDYAERRPGHDIPFSAVTSTRFLTTALEYDFTYALSTDGIVWGWGGPPIPLTAANYSVRRWKGLWNGGTTSGVPTHRCLLSEQNEAWCEGANLFGELGRGVRGGDRNDLALVSGNRVWRTLALGGRHSCGIDSEGLGWCWGSNKEGQLGDGTTTDRLIPTAIAGGFRWRTLSAAGYGDDGATTCGIRDDGRAYCWGRGPLGNGGVNASSLPLAVTGTTQTWVDIAVGPTHRCGTTSNREVWCWGRNLYGETQPASTALDLNTPTRVTGVAADRVTTLGRAYNTFVWAATCAWSTSTPYLACWGDNHLGLVDPSAEGYRGAFNTPQEVRLP